MRRAATHVFVLVFGAFIAMGAASADPIIGVNFVGGGGGGGTGQDRVVDNADGAAGVVPQINWNNLNGNTGGPSALIDSDGAATSASVTWSGSPNSWTTGNGSSTADHIMMNGYLDTSGSSTTSVSVSDVPFSEYDVYLYFDGDASGRSGAYTVNGNTKVGTDNGNPSGNFTGTFLEDVGGGAGGNYLLFSGLSDAMLDISATPGGGFGDFRAPVNGFQIVNTATAIPEPTSIAIWSLIGLGLAGFGYYRMRRRK